jgi:hypothetical protein
MLSKLSYGQVCEGDNIPAEKAKGERLVEVFLGRLLPEKS